MLAGGQHVKIGDQEFRLATDFQRPYEYSQRFLSSKVDFWLWDDWVGGEGNDAYDPFDPVVYHQGLANGRARGKLTTPPTRALATTDTLSPVPNIAFAPVAGGKLYAIGEQVSGGSTSYWHTTNLSSFTELSDNGWNSAIDEITAVATDGDNIYVVGWNTGDGNYQIRTIAGNGATVSGQRSYANGNSARIIGAATLGDFLYVWNGNKLRERNISDGTSASENTVFSRGGTPAGTYDSDFWGGMVSGENSLFFFVGIEGQTTVYEYSWTGGAAPIWDMQEGFTGKDIVYSNGALLVLGEYQGKSCLWGMSTISRQPIFVGFVREDEDLDLRVLGSGFGTEVLMGSRDGEPFQLFTYSLEQDAISQIDEVTLSGGQCWALGSYKGKRVAALEEGNDLNLFTWTPDDDPSITVDGRMESGVWDMDLPEEEKQLDGIHILADLTANDTDGSVEVFYQDDEDGTWTSAGSATTADDFHKYLQVSNSSATVKFRTLRVRIDPKDGAEVFAVSVRYRINTYEEEWVMLLDMRDEVEQSRGRRPRSSNTPGWQKRAYLRDIADNKAVVTLLDGFPYPEKRGADPNKSNSHSVNVEILSDTIDAQGEGTMLVRMKSVDTN
jgi:hypothetical protein